MRAGEDRLTDSWVKAFEDSCFGLGKPTSFPEANDNGRASVYFADYAPGYQVYFTTWLKRELPSTSRSRGDPIARWNEGPPDIFYTPRLKPSSALSTHYRKAPRNNSRSVASHLRLLLKSPVSVSPNGTAFPHCLERKKRSRSVSSESRTKSNSFGSIVGVGVGEGNSVGAGVGDNAFAG